MSLFGTKQNDASMVAELQTQLEAALANAGELQANLEAAKAENKLLTAALEMHKTNAAKQKMANRLKELKLVVGDEKAEELANSTSALDDAAFNSIVSVMKMSMEQEEVNFGEVGHSNPEPVEMSNNVPINEKTSFLNYLPKKGK